LRANPNLAMFRKAIKFVDAIIVNCNFNKELLSEIAGSEVAKKAKIIHHFAEIPVEDYQKKIKILIVGGFVERKGHDLLFKAIRSLGKEANNLEIWVAGYPGPLDMEQLAKSLGVEDKVKIFGSMTDDGLDFLYQHCDIFCLPSRTDKKGVSEGLPVALIEAMSYGKPVIATKLGGIPEIVDEVLVDEGDIKGIAKAIKLFTENSRLRESSGERNLDIVKTLYSKRNVSKMLKLWLDNISG
ncbi:MAG: glycosyltransferase family 4 protein, partial [Elusimicrobiota bacterium]